jgi:hypothetical protein
MTEREMRRFEARRAMRDIITWATKLGEKLTEARSFTNVQLQVLKIECDAFEDNCEEFCTKFSEFVNPEMRYRMERFSLILNTIDWYN